MEQNRPANQKSCLININKEVNELAGVEAQLEQWNKRSIYIIPACISDLNKKAYKPQIVSIGPYHHDMKRLKAMEEHKRRALLHFLKRSNICLETLVQALRPMVQELKDAYDQLHPKWHQNNEAFLDMMILDGCFILEILLTYRSSNNQDYARNDPIFSKHGQLCIVPYLKRDILMLENQIPMSVLEKLASVQNYNELKEREKMTKLIVGFFSKSVPDEHQPKLGECLHLLHMYRKILLPEETSSNTGSIRKDAPDIIRSTTELSEAGIHIEKSTSRSIRKDAPDIIRSATELSEAGIHIENSTSKLKDISFEKGVLKLPELVVDDEFESLYLNLIAFEKFHVGVGNEVTSYIFFMDSLIDNDVDVRRLHSCKVLKNALGSDKAVADLFNSLSKDMTVDPDSYLHKVHKDVTEYCRKICHRWQASFWQSYCANPWVFISVVAAICLFALTILQAVYSVLGYVKPPK